MPQRTPSMDSTEGHIRKRVCKACDRCRLKKSKCDGASPCSRCKADNAICVFGERKKLHDKVYPKGYVEMLEHQQMQLVSGMRELYRRLQAGESWPGAPLQESSSGHPLTHDILERLDLLYMNSDTVSPADGFEEDFSKMQQRLVENGASYMQRRGSISSDSEHGQESTPGSMLGTPPAHQMTFSESHHGAPPTPPMDSPFLQPPQFGNMKPSPALAMPGGTAGLLKPDLDPQVMMRSPFAMAAPTMDDATMVDYVSQFDASLNYDPPMSFEQYALGASPSMATPDWVDPNDVDFNHFLDQVGP